jgi:hypothetical protein
MTSIQGHNTLHTSQYKCEHNLIATNIVAEPETQYRQSRHWRTSRVSSLQLIPLNVILPSISRSSKEVFSHDA